MGVPDAVTASLARVEAACERIGLDEQRRKMLMQILIFGDVIGPAPELEPLPDVADMRMALEMVQTWFNVRPQSLPHLNADVMRTMHEAGYSIEGGIT